MANGNFLSATGEAMLFFPEESVYLFCSAGTGDNLLPEDVKDGYVDYVDWTSYRVTADCGEPAFEEIDGGMLMSKDQIIDLADDILIDGLKYEASLNPADKPSLVYPKGGVAWRA